MRPRKSVKVKRGRPRALPELRREVFSVRMPRWIIDWMNKRKESPTELIEHSLKTTYRLTPP